MHFVPFHAEHFREHAFDQVMAQGELARDFAARRGKTHLAALHSHQAVFLKTSERHGYCWRGNRKPVGQSSRDDRGTFTLGLEDGLKIVLLGDGNHWKSLYGGLSTVNEFLEYSDLTTKGTKAHEGGV